MRSFDFTPLLRSSVGFENLNRLVDAATRGEGNSYPPYNIEKLGDDAYRISMAVAGFAEDELDVTVHENVLIISGQVAERDDDEAREFLHRGIGTRAFERRFELADTIKVTGADYAHGLLNIELAREIPEEKKPRKIAIGDTGAPKTIDAHNDDGREAA
ncbi:Hsp20 family protein [Parasphingopyxis sp. CP4]|uniref:Hsp20 family protein n=1 Tax=Parasphingopyxis sp. CP4 TaxID=2724527 RepID=UPI0015A1209B|nr:Hsp20 family protein [Parasphingopyxis sp. CP4]QLC21213.1 Hsp20 family protein [Parasphingopyxis sp. CP4]